MAITKSAKSRPLVTIKNLYISKSRTLSHPSSAPKILSPAKIGKVTPSIARAAVKFVMDRRRKK